MNKKYNVLFIKDDKSMFDADSKVFKNLFITDDKTLNKAEALKFINTTTYDIVINDISIDFLGGIKFVKELKEIKPEQEVVILVSPDNEDKLSEIVDLGIHVFLLNPEDFEQALEVISQMDLNRP